MPGSVQPDDGQAEGDQGVALAPGQRPETALLRGDVLLDPRHVADLGPVHGEDHDHDGDEHHRHDRQRHEEPFQERDRLAGGLLDEVAADQVGRAADRQEQPADGDAVGDHQHERRPEPQARRTAVRRRCLALISPPTLVMTPMAIGSIIAAAPVFDMNGDVNAPIRPKARMIRVVECPRTACRER